MFQRGLFRILEMQYDGSVFRTGNRSDMKTTSESTVIDLLNWRYATKEFDAQRKIDEETISAIEESLVLAPSSYGLQPWKFFVVSDEKLKEQMPEISWGQQQLKDCSHVVVLTIKAGYSQDDLTDFIERMAEVRGVTVESLSGYKEFAGASVDKANEEGWIDDWSKNQVYLALGHLLLTAATLGVDACPMEGIEPEKYDALLGLEDSGYKTAVVCPLGYRSENDKYATAPKVRFPKEVVLERR